MDEMMLPLLIPLLLAMVTLKEMVLMALMVLKTMTLMTMMRIMMMASTMPMKKVETIHHQAAVR